jgi:hypothetical protein
MNVVAPVVRCLLSIAALAAPASAFDFTPPAQWRDLSPGAPAPGPKDFPDSITQEAASGDYVAFAADPVADADGSYATFSARVVGQTAVISEKFLEGFTESSTAAVAQQGFRYKVDEKGLEEVQGVRVGRVVGTLSGPEGTARQLVYVMPGRDATAVLVYTCSPADFARRLPSFEAAARRTGGIRELSRLAWLFGTDAGHYVLGKVTGVLVGVGVMLFLVRVLRRR